METLPHEKQIEEYIQTIQHLKKQNKGSTLFHSDISSLEKKLERLQEKVYSKLTPWDRVLISRHPSRPHTVDYVQNICSNFEELCGDRTYSEDPSVLGGLATIGDMACVIVGQDKGNDTESRLARNFGMVSPEGFRKALRLMRLAEKFHLPIVSLIDTQGAWAGLDAEERGQGWVIARNLREMASIAVPIIVIIIGEGCSGGALAMGVGDVIGMLEHSYYSVISPEGCASILWRDPAKKVEAANTLRLNAEDLQALGVIDAIIKEPLGGAHNDPSVVYDGVKAFILEQGPMLQRLSPDLLREQRYQKFRKMGKYKR